MEKDKKLPYELWEDENHLWKNEDIAEKAKRSGVQVGFISEFDSTSLHLAAFYNDFDTVKLLVENKVDLESKNSKGQTALAVAAANPNTSFEILEFLIDAGSDIEVKDLNGYTPLTLAILSENINFFAYKEGQEVPYLLEKNANVNAASFEGNPPLVYAAIKGNPHTVRKLLEFGANINFQNQNMYTPAMIAVIFDNVQAFTVILKFNPDLSLKNLDGKSVEDLVEESGNQRMIDAYRNR